MLILELYPKFHICHPLSLEMLYNVSLSLFPRNLEF